MTSISRLSPDVSYYHLPILQMNYLRNLTKSFHTVLKIESKVWL